jgi:hypothetical protein
MNAAQFTALVRMFLTAGATSLVSQGCADQGSTVNNVVAAATLIVTGAWALLEHKTKPDKA